MPNTPRFADRVRLSLREQLLDAAATLLAEHGFRKLRMADVAEATGVSRQTVYNEFGNKEALVEAVGLRAESRFLTEAERRMRAHRHPIDGLVDALTWVIEHARRDPLVASVLGVGDAADLLPFLTGARGTPLLTSGIDLFAGVLDDRAGLGEARARALAELLYRLAVSHIALPTSSPAAAAGSIAEFVAPQLTD